MTEMGMTDTKSIGAREGDEVDRIKWRILLCCGEFEQK